MMVVECSDEQPPGHADREEWPAAVHNEAGGTRLNESPTGPFWKRSDGVLGVYG